MGELIDFRTTIIFTGLLALTVLGGMIYLITSSKTYPGFKDWTLAAGIYITGHLLILLRNTIPDFLTVVTANMLIIIGMVLLVRGLIKFFQHRQNNCFDRLFILSLLIGFLVLTYWRPDVRLRIILTSLATALIHLRAAGIVFTRSAKVLNSRNTILPILFTVLAVSALARAVLTLTGSGRMEDMMAAGSLHGLILMVFALLTLAIYFSLVMVNYQRLEKDLMAARAEVKTLSGFIPICAKCKKVRQDDGYWDQIEAYITRHSEAQFSHGICPDCRRELYPEMMEEEEANLGGRDELKKAAPLG